MLRTYCLYPYRVVLHVCAWGSEKDDTSIRGVVDHVVSYHTVAARNADTIRPLLKEVRTCWTNLVVLDGDVRAAEVPFIHMKARPSPRIVRVNVFDDLVSVRATHFDICAP